VFVQNYWLRKVFDACLASFTDASSVDEVLLTKWGCLKDRILSKLKRKCQLYESSFGCMKICQATDFSFCGDLTIVQQRMKIADNLRFHSVFY